MNTIEIVQQLYSTCHASQWPHSTSPYLSTSTMSAIMPTMASTYGSWLISLFLETILYGIGILQIWLFFQWSHKDGWSIKLPVSLGRTMSLQLA